MDWMLNLYDSFFTWNSSKFVSFSKFKLVKHKRSENRNKSMLLHYCVTTCEPMKNEYQLFFLSFTGFFYFKELELQLKDHKSQEFQAIGLSIAKQYETPVRNNAADSSHSFVTRKLREFQV